MSRRRLFSSKSPRRGMVAVQVALTLTALMGIVAIAADGGIMLAQRRHAQATADAAALAAAADLFQKYNTNVGDDIGGTASTSAIATAHSNGYLNDGVAANGTNNAANSSTVVVRFFRNNYSSGPRAGTAVPKGYVEVTVTYYQGRSFSLVFGSGTIPISARAVARGQWLANSDAGLIALNPSVGLAVRAGSGSIAVTNGGIIVDSSAANAVEAFGNSTITGTFVKVTGGVNNGNGGIQANPGSVTTGVPATPDPLGFLPVPSPGSLTAGSFSSVANGGTNPGSTYTLSPGIYGAGGTTLPNFGPNDSIIFQQASAGNNGIYYLASGGFNFSGMNVKMDGGTSGGLMFYNAGTTSSDVFNLIVSDNTNPSTLSPLTSGVYQGISYFQNRLSTQPIYLGNGPIGSPTFTITGTYYAVGATLNLTGNGDASFGSQVIVDQVSVDNPRATIGYDARTVGRRRVISLVE